LRIAVWAAGTFAKARFKELYAEQSRKGGLQGACGQRRAQVGTFAMR
jgi:hypothetical protein